MAAGIFITAARAKSTPRSKRISRSSWLGIRRAPYMQEARANILRLGGIPRMNTYSKLYLALLGQFPWKYLPAIPVEMILLPNWVPFNIYKMSSWSRAMLIPLAIINHFKPTRELPGLTSNSMNFIRSAPSTRISLCRAIRVFSPGEIFSCAPIDALKISRTAAHGGRCGNARSRKRSAGCWSGSGRGATDLAAVFPAMLNSLIALRALGYSDEASDVRKGGEGFCRAFCGRPGRFSHSALLFAGLGHRDQRHCAGGIRDSRGAPRP